MQRKLSRILSRRSKISDKAPFYHSWLVTGFLLAIVCIAGISCFDYSTNFSCKRYKTGLFQYSGAVSGEKYAIERNDSIQMEVNIKRRFLVKKSINWLDSCSYMLTYISGHDLDGNPVSKAMIEQFHGTGSQYFRIIGGTEQYYIYRGNPAYTDTMWVVN